MDEREHYGFVIDGTTDGAYTLSVHINGQAVRVKYAPKNDAERALLASAQRDHELLRAVVRAGIFVVGVRAAPP